jgi:hypothetical protein
MSSPSQVNLVGIRCPLEKAELVSSKVIVSSPCCGAGGDVSVLQPLMVRYTGVIKKQDSCRSRSVSEEIAALSVVNHAQSSGWT